MANYFLPTYQTSWALIVGVNQYQNAPPLNYACNDANAVGAILKEKFGFADENVTTLLDSDATRAKIMEHFLALEQKTCEDDRVFFFFAGHGMTKTSNRRGEVGYLVPVEGDPNNISTLIRWDELTRNSDLIPSKHIFFVMDACYGGLATTRSLGAGSTRFLKDMLQRYARQVLTAGKADEVVADEGGPKPGHSIFTGHFLVGLEGGAATTDGIVTANGVMAYVYDKVAKDQYSNQTPHFGFVDGDGDFIFNLPDMSSEQDGKEQDVFINVPPSELPQEQETSADKAKALISDQQTTIKLHDDVLRETRNVLAHLHGDEFRLNKEYSDDEFLNRLRRYEEVTAELTTKLSCIAHWGEERHRAILTKVIQRIAESNELASGNGAWIHLRWFPIQQLLYYCGISAIASGNYGNLKAIFHSIVPDKTSRFGAQQSLLVEAAEAMLELRRMELFKRIPGRDRNYAPQSEYLHQRVQPLLDDLFFLGQSYDLLFDRFEMLYALVYMELTDSSWAPVGRFGWKEKQPFNDRGGPIQQLVAEAALQENQWQPIQSGLFFGGYDKFEDVVKRLLEHVGKLPWI